MVLGARIQAKRDAHLDFDLSELCTVIHASDAAVAYATKLKLPTAALLKQTCTEVYRGLRIKEELRVMKARLECQKKSQS